MTTGGGPLSVPTRWKWSPSSTVVAAASDTAARQAAANIVDRTTNPTPSGAVFIPC
jgi:hypothetical protein